MDPLAPTTSTLAPAISHIAVTAAGLATKLQGKPKAGANSTETSDKEKKRAKDRETVKWVLDSPSRWADMDAGAVREEWEDVKGLLDKWEGTDGVESLRKQCQKVLEDKKEDAEED